MPTPLGPLAPAHPEPAFHLSAERWLPVTGQDGVQREVTLTEAFRDAHNIRSIASADPLEVAALTRFLVSITYLIYSHSRDITRDTSAWTQALHGGELPEVSVDAVLDRLHSYLWLLHPTTPFLQEPLLRDRVTNAAKVKGDQVDQATAGFHSVEQILLRPNYPWLTRNDPISALTFAHAARALITRHFYRAGGNEMDLYDPATGKPSRYAGGGIGATSKGDFTQFFRQGPTLGATLTANLIEPLAERPWGELTWYEDHHLSPGPLWRLTHSAAATYLLPPTAEHPGAITHLLRSRSTTGPDTAKATLDAAKLEDPYTIWVPKKDDASPHRTQDAAKIIVRPERSQHRNTHDALSKITRDNALPNVLTGPSVLDVRHSGVTALCATLAGSSSYVYDHATTITWDPRALTAPRAIRVRLHGHLSRVVASSGSLTSQLRYRVRSVSDGRDKPADTAFSDVAEAELMRRCDQILNDLTTQILDGEHPDPVLPDAVRTALVEAVVGAFRTATQPFVTSGRGRVSVEEHAAKLRTQARGILR